jgi:small subunit ribosomal protein S2
MVMIDKMKSDGSWETLNKREKLFKTRQREKLEKTFGSIAEMTRQPAAIFIVDILKEHIALAEAHRLNIPTFAMVDTNSNPKLVDFPIPANDDATKSISLIMEQICEAIREGLEDRKNSKTDKDEAETPATAPVEKTTRARKGAAASTEETPVAEVVAVEETPAVEEAPVAEVVAVEETPAVEEVVAEETPATEEAASEEQAAE